jgi:acyl dehydratase
MARYFEDFQGAERFVGKSSTITEAEILEFAQRYDPQPFHVDLNAAKESPYGGLIASGLHTLSFGFRLLIDTGVFADCSLGSPGIEKIRWLLPVRPGDILRIEAEVVAMRPSSSNPGRGILTMDYMVINQRGETVLTMEAIHFLRRRNK